MLAVAMPFLLGVEMMFYFVLTLKKKTVHYYITILVHEVVEPLKFSTIAILGV